MNSISKDNNVEFADVSRLEACSADAIESVLVELQLSKMALFQHQLDSLGYANWAWEIPDEECWGISFENPHLSGQAYFFYRGEVDYVVCYWDGPGHPRGIGESIDEQRLLGILRDNCVSGDSSTIFASNDVGINCSDQSYRWPDRNPATSMAS